jgi:hypothetical protein
VVYRAGSEFEAVVRNKTNPLFPDYSDPCAGCRPYSAGRQREEFARLLRHEVILENVALIGWRRVGKTAFLEEFRPVTLGEGWLGAGADLSGTNWTDEGIATLLLADLAVVTGASAVVRDAPAGGADSPAGVPGGDAPLDVATLGRVYARTPGLASDQLRAVLELAWAGVQGHARGVVFAYDHAQNRSDRARGKESPLSLRLEVFQAVPRNGIRFLLGLAGLPTLLTQLATARTFAERMFRVLALDRAG